MNQLDTLISRETLPKAKIMQEHDDNRDTPTPAEDTTNESELKVWERQILFIITVVIGMIGLLVVFIQPYIEHKSMLRLLEYSSTVFFVAGCLTLAVVQKIPKLIGVEQKRLSYIKVFPAGIILSLSLFWLLYIIYKLENGWWGYFSAVTMVTGYIIGMFSQGVGKEQKRLGDILDLISLVLILLAFCSICIAIFGVA